MNLLAPHPYFFRLRTLTLDCLLVAGYATEYDVSKVGAGVGSFEFVTVKGGRHEVGQ